ncbi:MAG TPA: YojF family protein [Symbiobacteriaceae bacterium]|nr:YojF family protein [Symbiobacteriaceae bacterium]
MEPFNAAAVEAALQNFVGRDLYLHLETTNGAYAGNRPDGTKGMAVCAYVRNAVVRFSRATVAGEGPFRTGLQMDDQGWIYAEGLTHWELDEYGRLILAGHDDQGRLAVALQLSLTPFVI